MRINQLEYLAPNQSNPLGSLRVDVEIPILFKAGQKEISQDIDAEVTLSPETVAALNHLSELIIKDLEKTNG